jgi:hypothetical protein
VYLGRDPALAEEVRAALREMQRSLEEKRGLRRQVQAARKVFRDQQRELDRELARVGLYRKGSEIRGWRGLHGSAPPRTGKDQTRGGP